MQQVEKQTGITPLALRSPPFPQEIEYLWAMFLELSSARSPGYSGPLPLSYQEIYAWKELTGNCLSIWEVDVIKRLDRLYVKVVSNGRS